MPVVIDGNTVRKQTRQQQEPAHAEQRQFPRPYIPESSTNLSIKEDGDTADWLPLGGKINEPVSEKDRVSCISDVRWLAKWQPNVKQALRLYRSYVLGRNFSIAAALKDKTKEPTDSQSQIIRDVNQAWKDFLKDHRGKWSPAEFGTRSWRDGEQFTRKFFGSEWPPQVRFLDPEEIGDESGSKDDSLGVVTKSGDSVTPVAYKKIDRDTKDLIERIHAEEIVHTKIDVDSNEKRGVSRLISVTEFAKMFRQLIGNEVEHRNLQSSIVIHRKVKGGPNRVTSQLDTLKSSTTNYPEASIRREKWRRASIVTTNDSVEIDFKQPESNFSDASPLVKWLILQISASTGWPYYMIATDSADSNFAATLVQESPVNMMVEMEQDFFKEELLPIWEFVISVAIRAGRVKGLRKPDKFFEEYEAGFKFPTIATRDRLKESQANNLLVMMNAMSPQEVARRDGLDPEQMEREIKERFEDDILGAQAMAISAANTPGVSSLSNQTGQNQGGSDTKSKGSDSKQQARRSAQGGK